MADIVWEDGASGQYECPNAPSAALEYATYGASPDKAPTIVMLHEGLGCVALWRDFPQQLAKQTGCGVFVYSRAGYGASSLVSLPRPLDYMTNEAVEVLPQMLDAIGFEKGVLLGHSDGATIAAIYAGSVIDHRVRGLVLLAPHFFAEPSGLASIAKAKEAFENGDLRQGLMKYHKDADNAFRGWNDAWLDPEFVNWNVAEVIEYFRVPVLVIQGKQDQYGTIAQITEIEDRIYSPLDVVMLDDCKHAPQFDQPNLTVSAVQDFMARLIRIEKEKVTIA